MNWEIQATFHVGKSYLQCLKDSIYSYTWFSYRAQVSAFFSDLQSGNEYMPRRKPITLVSEVVSAAWSQMEPKPFWNCHIRVFDYSRMAIIVFE